MLLSSSGQIARDAYKQWQGVLLVLACIFSLQACTSLPSRYVVPASYHQTDTQDTALGQIATTLQPKPDHLQNNQKNNLTGYQLLYDPIDAISARLLLIKKAQKSLDLQYYIWQNDNVGALACEALIQAADRGVKIRLLLDDNNTKGMDAILLALSQHPNIEVRLFNPFIHRNIRSIDYAFDFKRTNRRMHNKVFIADGQFAIIGGRNISNQYFDAGESFQFSDIDVMLAGQVVPEISQSFDNYWNYQAGYPAQQMIKAKNHRLTLESLRLQLAKHHAKEEVQKYLELVKNDLEFEQWLQSEPALEWVTYRLVQDAPEKIDKDANPSEHLAFQLQHAVGMPTQQVDIISAYFVIDHQVKERLAGLSRQGVKVRILTNSFAANDVKIVHAFYAQNRQFLLENNIELYEFMPVIKNNGLWRKKRSKRKLLNIKGTSDASLHAKMMQVDRQQVFIGSFNFDLRSANINTEIGVILDSAQLARQVSEEIDRNILNVSYRLHLDEKGHLLWDENTPEGIKTYTKEPNVNLINKVGLKAVTLLPIAGLM